MTVKDAILDGLKYDQWANDLWDKTLLEWPNPRANETRGHITNAKRNWLERMTGQEHDVREVDLDARYIAFVEATDLTEVLEYQNLRGDTFRQPLHQILHHVIFHGQYHRGQLRALAEEDGIEWPETDMIAFFRVQ